MISPGIHHFVGDLYPNQGFSNTRYMSIPEPEDQVVMAEQGPQGKASLSRNDTNPQDTQNIFMAVGFIFVLVVLLGMRF